MSCCSTSWSRGSPTCFTHLPTSPETLSTRCPRALCSTWSLKVSTINAILYVFSCGISYISEGFHMIRWYCLSLTGKQCPDVKCPQVSYQGQYYFYSLWNIGVSIHKLYFLTKRGKFKMPQINKEKKQLSQVILDTYSMNKWQCWFEWNIILCIWCYK